MPLSRRTLLTATAAVPLSAAGCTSSKTLGKTTTTRKGTPDKVTYLTGLGTFGREGYAVVADTKGYFGDGGCQVDIRPGTAGTENLAALGAGKAQFVTIDWSTALLRAANGTFGGFRMVAAMNPATLIAVMALAGRGIDRPTDLAGRHLAGITGAIPQKLFPAYARLAGFDPSHVSWTTTGSAAALPALLAVGRVDGIGQFVVGQPAVQAAAEKAGHTQGVVVFPYSNFMTDMYGNVLVTTTKLLGSNPDLVRRFTLALMRGLRDAVDNPQQAGVIVNNRWSTTPADVATAELTLLAPYVAPDQPGHGLGAFDRTKVARGVAALQADGLYPNAVDPGQLVDFNVVAA